MFKSYLKFALREMMGSKTACILSLIALASGMACFIVIFLYVLDELSYDQQYEHAHRIFRVAEEATVAGKDIQFAITPFPMGPTLVANFPEVIDAVRLSKPIWRGDGLYVGNPPHFFFEKGVVFAYDNVFDLFDFPLIFGDSQGALARPASVVLSQEMAAKYFGDENPMGETLSIGEEYFEVTGVMAPINQKTHLNFDFIATKPPEEDNWESHQYFTYILLDDARSAEELEAKLPIFVHQHMGTLPAFGVQVRLFLQPLEDIYLHSDLQFELSANGDILRVYLFASVAVVILLLSCVGFVSVSTACAPRRSKEIGLKKVLGAHRWQLISQYLCESVLFALMALLIALIIVYVSLPVCSAVLGIEIRYDTVAHWKFVTLLVGIVVLAGIVAGIYPALVLSSYQPIQTLKGHIGTRSHKATMRKVIVAFQSALATTLVIGTAVIFQQSTFLKQMELGFNSNEVIVLPNVLDPNLLERYRLNLSEYKEIATISASSALPGRQTTAEQFRSPLQPDDESVLLNVIYADYDFVQTLGLEMTEGRDFSRRLAYDGAVEFILNEAATREFGWTSITGKELVQVDQREGMTGAKPKGQVVGVVRDFNYQPLHLSISPLVIVYNRDAAGYLSVRIETSNLADTLTLLKTKWRELAPHTPFEYSFLDDPFDEMYRSQNRLTQFICILACFTVLIAGLGLFGLARHTVHMRQGEIAMRKILGGSATSIVCHFSKELVRVIGLSNVIAWPLAYYCARSWLDYYAYRIDIGLPTFVFGSLFVLAVATVSTSYEAWHVTRVSPARILELQ